MSIGDLLSGIGRGLATTGRAAGSVLEPIAERTAEVVSGQAPQIDAEKRQQAAQLTNEQREIKANELEQQLEMGRKYGTLSAEDQKQYVDAITGLYSKPEDQGSLIQRLHKAIHPQGTTRQAATAPLKNATPEGGVSAEEERRKNEAYQQQLEQDAQAKQKGFEDSWKFFSKYIPQEDLPKAQSEWAMKNLGIAQTLKNIPGAAGQPVKGNDGRYYRPMQQADGTVVQQPMPPDWKPAQKPPVMKPGTVNGVQAFAYYDLDKGSWIDSNTHQPVNFKPQPNFAQTGLWGLDTGYDSQGNPVPVMMNRRTGQVAPAPAGIVAPTQAKGIEATRTAAIAGDSLLRTMIGAADRAKAGDQQAQLSIVANHIGMTLGAQKGARINQAVWNEATESAPWLQNVAKRFGPDGYLQGVTLSPQQVDQMVELGKLRRDVMWEQASQTAQAAGVSLQVPPFELHPTGVPNKPITGAGRVGGLLPKTGAIQKPANAVGTVTYQGKKYWVDKDRNNLGEAQ